MDIFQKEIVMYPSFFLRGVLFILICTMFILIKFTKDFIGFEVIRKDLSDPPVIIVLFAVIVFTTVWLIANYFS